MDIIDGNSTSGLKRLEQIRTKNKSNTNWINQDLYRLLYKEDMYISAYENIKSNKGATTPGSTSETLDGFSLKKIQNIIELMREKKFEFKPSRRIYIPKPGKKSLRPLGIPNATEKIVQEVIRMILEAIYEPTFSESSHGFRPQRSCHTVLKQIETQFDGVKWLIEGDIKAAYDTVDHKVLIKLLRRRINDDRFIQLIKKALEAGYLERPNRHITSLIGTPQGSIISPILFNIYLSPLDDYLGKLQEFYKTEYGEKKRKTTTEYNENATKMAQIKRSLDTRSQPSEKNSEERTKLVSQLKLLKRQRVKTQAYRPETVPISIYYVRYADDWVIGVNGPQQSAVYIKDQIAQFLKTELNLDLSPEKTKITYLKKDVGLFLGYEIRVGSSIRTMKIRNSKGVYYLKRVTGHFIELQAPIQQILSRLAIKGFCDGKGNPQSKRSWTTFEDSQIVKQFNWVMNGLFHYYSGAVNQRKLIRIQYILQHSCACTLAHRHQSSVSRIYAKHGKSMKVTYTVDSKTGPKEKTSFLTLRKFNKTQIKWLIRKEFYDPFQTYAYRRTRSKISDCCCVCGVNSGVEMHHIRHLKTTVNTKGFDQVMGLINRKQIPVCRDCHKDIHNGRYDGIVLSDLARPDIAKR